MSTNGGITYTKITGATSTTYSFTTTAGESGYKYEAVVSNVAGSATSAAGTLTVDTVPVTTNPSSQTVNSGQLATFKVTVSGTPAPSVQWQVSTNGGSTYTKITGATSTTYSFTATAGQSGYKYEAVVSSVAGSVTTTAATLTVNSAPVVSGNPSSQTVAVGGSAIFNAKATGTPAPTVQWQVSTNGGSTYAKITGATSTTYTLTKVTAAQSGYKYEAVFTNTLGKATTAAATLTIAAAAKKDTLERRRSSSSVNKFAVADVEHGYADYGKCDKCGNCDGYDDYTVDTRRSGDGSQCSSHEFNQFHKFDEQALLGQFRTNGPACVGGGRGSAAVALEPSARVGDTWSHGLSIRPTFRGRG